MIQSCCRRADEEITTTQTISNPDLVLCKDHAGFYFLGCDPGTNRIPQACEKDPLEPFNQPGSAISSHGDRDGWCDDQGRAVPIFPPGCSAARDHRCIVRTAG